MLGAQIIPVNIENLYTFILREIPESKHETAEIYKEAREILDMIVKDGLRRIIDPQTGEGLLISEFENILEAKTEYIRREMNNALEMIRQGKMGEGLRKLHETLVKARNTMLVLAAVYSGLARIMYLNLPPRVRPAMGKIPLGYETL